MAGTFQDLVAAQWCVAAAPGVKHTWKLPLHKIVVCPWLEDIARDEYGDTQASLVRV